MNKPYKIWIRETLEKCVEVEAASIDDAFIKVKNFYKQEEIVLNYNDYVDTEFFQEYD